MHYKTNDDMLICELSNDGMPIEVIADKMEATLLSVLATLDEYAIGFTHVGSIESVVADLFKSGLTTKRIIELTDFNRATVNQAKRKLGLSKPTPRSDKSFAERYQMVVSLVSDGMTVTEACRNVRLSSRDYVKMKALG
jgi:DNA-binding NarL/FixJ family response regulator